MSKFIRLAPGLLAPGGVLDKAECAAQRALAADVRNGQVLWRLGDIYRMQGNFDAARDSYRCLSESGPGRLKASWLVALLDGRGLPEAAPHGTCPAPFVRMKDFLTAQECDYMFALALARREHFGAARVWSNAEEGPRVKPESRITLEMKPGARRDFRLWFLPRLERAIPEILARLRLEDPGRYRITMNVRVYPAGGFYTVHRDNSVDSHRDRVLSFICFFHPEPRRFSGGDLLLYDSNQRGGHPVPAFSRIKPLRGGIVFFMSGDWHQVTPVECDADDFGAGRFVLSGHVCFPSGSD